MKTQALSVLFASALLAGGTALQAASLSSTDSTFLQKAAEGALAEQQIGQLAQQRGNTPAIKQFGQRLAADHQAEYKSLTAVANKIGAQAPNSLTGVRQQEVQKLQNYNGSNFDKVFARWVSEDHQKSINMFQHEAQNGNNPELKGFAAGALADLKDHLHTAQMLENNPNMTAANMGHANRSMNENGAWGEGLQPGQSRTIHATVENYQAGQSLNVKARGRAGTHHYDLTNGAMVHVNGNVQPGTKVTIVESVDQNGQHTVTITPQGSNTKH